MRAKSCFSTNLDSYRAGNKIGEELALIQPEVLFLFSSIHYEGSVELIEGIYDALGSEDAVLIGNSGDGFYEYSQTGEVGVSALGLNSEGKVNWHLVYESNVGETPFESSKRCLDRINEAFHPAIPSLYYLASDFRTDSCEVIRGLQERAFAPVVGGLAGDTNGFEQCFVYVNREVLTDCIAVLGVEGPISYEIRIAQRLHPVGRPGVITKGEGTNVHTIENIPAMDFLERELGKPLDVVDEGALVLELTNQDTDLENQVRSILLTPEEEGGGSIKLFGGLQEGDRVQTCVASPFDIIQDVKNIGESLTELSFEPVAGLIVSCAGRKKILAGNIENEVQDIVQNCRSLKALVGYPSFGEFGPVKTDKGYSRALFHNMTFILLLIGDLCE